MPDIHFIRGEIEHMRGQVAKQRKEILSLQLYGSVQPSSGGA